MNTPARKLRSLLDSGEFIVAPGVYDGYSAKLAEKAGFKALATSGAAIANSVLGMEDLGILDLTENVNRCRHIAKAVNVPVTADADAGYGNPVNVYHTVRTFEEAGLAGLNIEDQVHPKRCGHMPGKEVVPVSEMIKKIEAAVRARRDDAFVVIARTDSIAVEGIEGAVRRAKAYAEAGADMVFPDAVLTEEHIRRIVEAVDVPVTINMGFGIRARPTTPLFPIKSLKQWGVRRISVSRILPAAAIRGMKQALDVLKLSEETGEAIEREDLTASIDEIWELMGLESARALERELLSTEALELKYGTEKP